MLRIAASSTARAASRVAGASMRSRAAARGRCVVTWSSSKSDVARGARAVTRSTGTAREDEIEAAARRDARESVVSGERVGESVAAGEAKEYDVYRDSALRYMGYANECGEAFVAWLPVWGVPATYGVAATYVLADTVDKGVKRWKKAAGAEDRLNQAVAVATETVTWQMLASVFWPGSFIRVVVATTNLALAKADVSAFDALAAQGIDVERILPTLIGLAAIPFIVKPIDHTVDTAAEMSFAKAIHGGMKSGQDWAVGAAVMAGCLAVPPVMFGLAGVINEASGVVVG